MTSAPDIDALVADLGNHRILPSMELRTRAADALISLQADLKAAWEQAKKAEIDHQTALRQRDATQDAKRKFRKRAESAEASLAEAREILEAFAPLSDEGSRVRRFLAGGSE